MNQDDKNLLLAEDGYPHLQNVKCKDSGECGIGGYCSDCHLPHLPNSLVERLRDNASLNQAEKQREEAADHIEELESHLLFIERWASHHSRKQSAEECLGVIQHHPAIKAITKRYKDGVIPTTYDPYAEIAELRAKMSEHEDTIAKYRRIICKSAVRRV